MRSILLLLCVFLGNGYLQAQQNQVPETKLVPIGGSANEMPLLGPTNAVSQDEHEIYAQAVDRHYASWVSQGFWTWTPRQDYHQSIATVQRPDGGQGTGALIWRSEDGKLGLVATAAHVLNRGMGVVAWPNGYKSRAIVAAATPVGTPDGSLLWVVPPSDVPVIPVSDQLPKIGEYVEHCGYGGPSGNLRHFWGTVRDYRGKELITNCYLLNGDSGGPVLYNGKLVGMNSGGSSTKSVGIGAGSGQDWPLHFPAITCGPEGIRELLVSVTRKTNCPPGVRFCYPDSGNVFFGSPSPQHFPPNTFPSPNDPFVPSSPPAPSPQPQAPPPVDWQPQIESMTSQIGSLKDDLVSLKESIQKIKSCEDCVSKDDVNSLINKVNEHSEKLSSIPDLTALSSSVSANATAITETRNALNDLSETLTKQIDDKLQSVSDCKCDESGSGVGDVPDGGQPTPPTYTSNDLILYYTSRSCSECRSVDERIESMKARGWPIVITRLSPTDAAVQGVPRIYVPSKDRHVVGINNCIAFLSTLVIR